MKFKKTYTLTQEQIEQMEWDDLFYGADDMGMKSIEEYRAYLKSIEELKNEKTTN